MRQLNYENLPCDLVLKDDHTIEINIDDCVEIEKQDGSWETWIVIGGRAPHKASSSGRVYMSMVGADWTQEFFPHVFNMVWIYVPEAER